jgi:hypothetical protein
MPTYLIPQARSAPVAPVTARTENEQKNLPLSSELGMDLQSLEREERIALDRQRQEELARLRAVQSFD